MWRGSARFPTALNTNPCAFPLPNQTSKRDASVQWGAPSFTVTAPSRWPKDTSANGCVGLPHRDRLQPGALRPPHPGRGVPHSIPALGNQGSHPTPNTSPTQTSLPTFPRREAGFWACAVSNASGWGQPCAGGLGELQLEPVNTERRATCLSPKVTLDFRPLWASVSPSTQR